VSAVLTDTPVKVALEAEVQQSLANPNLAILKFRLIRTGCKKIVKEKLLFIQTKIDRIQKLTHL
jgi:hypothetical protein